MIDQVYSFSQTYDHLIIQFFKLDVHEITLVSQSEFMYIIISITHFFSIIFAYYVPYCITGTCTRYLTHPNIASLKRVLPINIFFHTSRNDAFL